MKKSLVLVFMILGICLLVPKLQAQTLNREEANEYIKSMPGFSIHKDNYFITGIPTNQSIRKNTSDIKYQISFKQLITRNTLPWNTYLFVTYSQKSFWNIYDESSPFKEINFNPSVGLGKPIFNKNNRMVGMASLAFEHESNGRDSIYSRSWNNINLSYAFNLNENTILSAKAWVPFMYKEGNPDLMEYIGYAEIKINHDFIRDKLSFELMARKGANWEWKGAVRSRVFYNPFNSANQYFMLEWYAGYVESLISYQKFTSMIRVGYVIKTDELNFLKPKKQ